MRTQKKKASAKRNNDELKAEHTSKVSSGAILRQHKNVLLEEIKKSGLDPSLFLGHEEKAPGQWQPFPRFIQWLLTPGFDEPIAKDTFTIRVKGSRLYFRVVNQYESWDKFWFQYNAFMPGYPRMRWQKADNTESLLNEFNEWLRFSVSDYIKETHAPDLWALLDEYRPVIDDATITGEDTSNFRSDEKPEIRESIRQFRSAIVNSFGPSPDQIEFIDEKLNYLSKAVDRLNRLDWRALAVSTVISIAVNLSADTERGRLLFHLFQDAFRSTLKLLQ